MNQTFEEALKSAIPWVYDFDMTLDGTICHMTIRAHSQAFPGRDMEQRAAMGLNTMANPGLWHYAISAIKDGFQSTERRGA